MGLFSFIGSIFGGNAAKDASTNAKNAQVDALNRGIDIQDKQFQQTRTDFMPYTQAGAGAVTGLAGMVNASDPAVIAQVKNGPLYQSLYANGQEALLAGASATGGLRGGNTQRGLADFGSDVLSQAYQQQLSNYASVANLGLGAQTSVANFGSHTADQTAALNGQIGTAQAANFLTRGGITANQWASAGSYLDDTAKALASIF